MADPTELARRFAARGHDQQSRSPFSASLSRYVAEDPAVVSLLAAAPEEQQLPVLLLATVHFIVLTEPDVDLARWYPSVTDAPAAGDPYPAFAQLCADRVDQIRDIVSTRSVQTNEVGRCSLLLAGLAAIASDVGPLGLVDVGTSAGLNLQLDRYAYVHEPGGTVGPSSPVRLECSTRGSVQVPVSMPAIAQRVGLDRTPVDLSDPDAATWLLACVWPDQADRLARLRAAIDVAAEAAPVLIRGDAVDDLAEAVGSVADQGHPVVTNSWAVNYLPADRQRRYVDALDDIGRRIDLSWISVESPGLCPGIPVPSELRGHHITVLTATTWRSGRRTSHHLGTAHPHGYWWHGPGPPPPGRGPDDG